MLTRRSFFQAAASALWLPDVERVYSFAAAPSVADAVRAAMDRYLWIDLETRAGLRPGMPTPLDFRFSVYGASYGIASVGQLLGRAERKPRRIGSRPIEPVPFEAPK